MKQLLRHVFIMVCLCLVFSPFPRRAAGQTLTVNAGSVLQTLDGRAMATSMNYWVSAHPFMSQFIELGIQSVRYGGGTATGTMDWTNNSYAYPWPAFVSDMTAAGIQGKNIVLTTNYDSGTPQMAANWVQDANINRKLGIVDWELGNEEAFNPEDIHGQTGGRPGTKNDPVTYANEYVAWSNAMKAVDPTVKLGAIIVGDSTSFTAPNGAFVVNPRTGAHETGWTPVLLGTLRSLGVTPDFVINHFYYWGPGNENDTNLLTGQGQYSGWTMAGQANAIRSAINDYCPSPAGVSIINTEVGSVWADPGKQSVSLVNGLFVAVTLGDMIQTEMKMDNWWTFAGTSPPYVPCNDSTANFNPALYGWRTTTVCGSSTSYGDYAWVKADTGERYPTFYVGKLIAKFVKSGDQTIACTSNQTLLKIYAVKHADGSVGIMVINTAPGTDYNNIPINLTGITASGTATVWSYGKANDNASMNQTSGQDLTQTTMAVSGGTVTASFPQYSVTLITLNAAPAVPPAPTGLTAAFGNGVIGLNWTMSSGATSYSVYRGTSAGGENGTAIVSGLTGTTYTNTGLTNGTTYYYEVKATNTVGTSAYSNEAHAAPSTSTPSLDINAGGPAASPFVADVDFSAGGTATNNTGAVTTTGVTNPAPAAVYQSERFGSFTYTIPGLPVNATYTVRMHFTEDFDTVSGQRLQNVTINGTQVLTNYDIFATTGTQHKANVQQFDTTVNSAGQVMVSFAAASGSPDANAKVDGIEVLGSAIAPSSPTGLTATPGVAQVVLAWNTAAGATSYNVLRSTVTGSGYASVATGISATSYTNTGLTNGTTYYFVVTATDAAGTSGNSNQASATPVATLPTVQINAGGPAAAPFLADVDFTAGTTATNNTGAVDTSAVTFPSPAAVYQSERYGTMTYTIPNLPVNAAYTVRLHYSEDWFTATGQRTFNVSINGTQVQTNYDIYAATGAIHKANIQQFNTTVNASGQIVIVFTSVINNAKVDGIEALANAIPSVPAGLTATAGNTQVALSWTAASGAWNYNVKRSTVSGSGYATVASSASTSYTNTGLTNGTTYYYVVTGTNPVGESANSAQASARPLPPIPAAPTGLVATPGNAQVALSWTASSGATSYNVKRSTVNGSGYATVSSPATTSYTNTGLTNGTTYYFVVTAVNLGGESGNSSQVSAMPVAPSGAQINCGGPAASPFVADADFSGGTVATNNTGAVDTSAVTSPAPAAVYQNERYGAMTYTIPGLTAGNWYKVRLHFTEDWFTATGQRTFNVTINGTQMLTNFDIYAATGAIHKAVIKEFTTTANASGQMVIAFANVVNNAKIDGIEVQAATVTNLVLNPGFESGATSWSLWSNDTVVASNAHSGTNSMQVGTSGGGEQIIACSPNAFYTESAWGKVTGGMWGAPIYVFYDSSSVEIGTAINLTAFTANYTQSSATFVTPANAATIHVQFASNAGSGYLYVDDFSLVKN